LAGAVGVGAAGGGVGHPEPPDPHELGPGESGGPVFFGGAATAAVCAGSLGFWGAPVMSAVCACSPGFLGAAVTGVVWSGSPGFRGALVGGGGVAGAGAGLAGAAAGVPDWPPDPVLGEDDCAAAGFGAGELSPDPSLGPGAGPASTPRWLTELACVEDGSVDTWATS